jgi:hypothetical protein
LEQTNKDRKSVIRHGETSLQERNSVQNSPDQLDQKKQHQSGESANDNHTNPSREEATKRSQGISQSHLQHLPQFQNNENKREKKSERDERNKRLGERRKDMKHSGEKLNERIYHPSTPSSHS